MFLEREEGSFRFDGRLKFVSRTNFYNAVLTLFPKNALFFQEMDIKKVIAI